MPSWIYLAGIALFFVACGVWALMLLGAWTSSIANPPPWLKAIALSEKFAKPIMKTMTRQIIVIVIAAAGVLAAFFDQSSVKQDIKDKAESVTANLLTKVRGDSTPPNVLDGLIAFSNVPTDLQRTTSGYIAYLNLVRAGSPVSIDLIAAHLPAEPNAFDSRLLGLAHDRFAERLSPKDPKLQREHWERAKAHYEAAINAMPALASFQLSPQARDEFQARLKSNLAGIPFSLAQLEPPGSAQRRQKLEEAAKSFLYLKNTAGLMGTYVNLASTYSLLGEFDPKFFNLAAQVLGEISTAPTLTNIERKLAQSTVSDLKVMHELVPLAAHIKQTKGTSWPRFVEGLFSQPLKP